MAQHVTEAEKIIVSLIYVSMYVHMWVYENTKKAYDYLFSMYVKQHQVYRLPKSSSAVASTLAIRTLLSPSKTLASFS